MRRFDALSVMAGLVPAIHDLTISIASKDVDARDKPGHDDGESRA
ncbi:hypothetical protein V1290_002352 [Bradyrhizobium sp. AZCC 1578]